MLFHELDNTDVVDGARLTNIDTEGVTREGP
jgi:hypothetical protein